MNILTTETVKNNLVDENYDGVYGNAEVSISYYDEDYVNVVVYFAGRVNDVYNKTFQNNKALQAAVNFANNVIAKHN